VALGFERMVGSSRKKSEARQVLGHPRVRPEVVVHGESCRARIPVVWGARRERCSRREPTGAASTAGVPALQKN
jgi:hypothetical protein